MGVGYLIASQGLMALGYNLIISPVVESLLHAKDLLPTQGGLTWYIMHRTSYNHHGEVLLNYVRSNFASVNTAIRRDPIVIKQFTFARKLRGTLQLFIYDLERIMVICSILKQP